MMVVEEYRLTWLLDICLILSDRAGPLRGVEKLTDNMFPITAATPSMAEFAELTGVSHLLKPNSVVRVLISPQIIFWK